MFIENQVRQLAVRRGYPAQRWELVTDILTGRVDGMFLWVSLIIRGLGKTSNSNVEQQLQHILSWVVTAVRPLTLEELAMACEIQNLNRLSHVNIGDLVQGIRGDIGLCGPILTIRNGHVNLIHQSAKVFFFSTITIMVPLRHII